MTPPYSKIMSAMLMVLILSPFVFAPKAQGNGAAYEVIAGVNNLRTGLGLSSLKINDKLMAAAQFQAEYMASICTGTHAGPDESLWEARAAAFGYGDGSKIYVLENTAAGEYSTTEVIIAWEGSDVHYRTMIRPEDTDIGAGFAMNCNWVFYDLLVGHVAWGIAYDGPPPAAVTPADFIFPVILSTPREDGAVFHVVQQGQTMWAIALMYGTTEEQLRQLNGIDNGVIYPGQKLIIRLFSTPTSTDSPTALPTLTIVAESSPPLKPTNTPKDNSRSSNDPFVTVSIVLGALLVFAVFIIVRLASRKDAGSRSE